MNTGLIIFLAVSLAGLLCCCAGVYLLAGAGWALVAAGVAVEVSTEDGNNFTTNMVTIRAEERLALAVYRPESFVHGEFDAP